MESEIENDVSNDELQGEETDKQSSESYERSDGSPDELDEVSDDEQINGEEATEGVGSTDEMIVATPSEKENKKEVQIETLRAQGDGKGMIPEGDPKPIKTQSFVFLHEADLEKRIELQLPEDITVEKAKAEVAKQLGISEENFKLFRDGKQLRRDAILLSDGKEILIESGLNESEIESDGSNGDRNPGSSEASKEAAQVRKVIKVQFTGFGGEKHYLEVAVVNLAYSKQYCGGYRNKQTGVVYYNAWSQTDHHKPGVKQNKFYTRETQTLLPHIDEGVNTLVNKCTQMAKSGVFIPRTSDIIVTARPYVAYDIKQQTMTPFEAVSTIQRAWRSYIIMKRVREYYKSMADARDAKTQFRGTSLQEFRKHQLKLLTADSFPITRSDFYDLYSILGEWKKTQLKELREQKLGFAYKAALEELQKQEMKGLFAIEEHRMRAVTENLQRQDIMFLEGTARSRVRQYPKGNVTIIDDLNIQRAREFKEMFASYERTDITKTERIEILTGIKRCLAEFEAVDMTADMIELLDREVDLILMGIDDKKMAILRKRFKSLYINFAKNPEFNPQAKYYLKSTATSKKYAIYRCHGCHKLMHPTNLFVHLRLARYKFCSSCNYMQQTATASTNLAPYKRILTSLRKAETEKCCRGSLSFLLQPWGMYFLVNVLWDGKSIISGSSYVPGLKVTRWLPNEEWSMWNMILLTELEAHEHEQLANPLEYYSHEFVLNVKNRNILGRVHFAAVANIDEKFAKRAPLGIMPSDYLLHTTKKAATFLPKHKIAPCLQPTTTNVRLMASKGNKCDAAN